MESNFNITKKYTYEDLIIKDDNLSALIEEVSEEEDEDNVEFNRNDYEIEGALGFNEISNEELQNAEEVDGIIFALPAVEIQLEDNDDLHLPTVHMDHNEQNAVEVETHNIVAYGKVIEENVQNDECSDNGGNGKLLF